MPETAQKMGMRVLKKSRSPTVCVVKRREPREKLAWEETPRAETDSGQDTYVTCGDSYFYASVAKNTSATTTGQENSPAKVNKS